MAGLGPSIEAFLTAAGYGIAKSAAACVRGERAGADGRTERVHVWFAETQGSARVDEPALLAAIEGEAVPAGAVRYCVVPSLAGFSTGFRERLAKAGVGLRVAVQFFDTPYKADGDGAIGTGGGEEARSVFAEFVEAHRDIAGARVPQPFVVLSSLGGDRGGFSAGTDLFTDLVAELTAPADGPRLTLVLGHAGAGKSVLFAALFTALHRHFAAQKRAQRLASRPILFLPEHIRSRKVRSLDGLLDAVAATDAAAATRPALMRWLNASGHTTWMFDGLDEFFAGEGDFVAAIEEMLKPGSQARILICTRDSLLTSSTALRQFVDRQLARGGVRLFELARWERASQSALASVRLAGSPQVASFVATLDVSPALSELATLPFYCDLLIGRYRDAKAAPVDEFDLLATAIDALIDREAAKLAGGATGFGWDVFAGADTFVEATGLVAELGVARFNIAEGRQQLLAAFEAIGRERLVELIEGLAHLMRTTEAYPNESRGLTTAEIADFGRLYMDVGLVPEMEPRVLLALIQLAFFAPAEEKDHVRFAHEIVADYLAARNAVAMIRSRPDSADGLGQALGVRADLERSVFLRYLVRELAGDADIVSAVRGHVEGGRVRPDHADNARLLLAELERGHA